jgi:hypothetical protein
MIHSPVVDERPAPAGHRFRILDVDLSLRSDDDGLASEFGAVFGGQGPAPAPGRATIEAVVRAGEGQGHGRLHVAGDGLDDPGAFLLSFASPTVPLRALPAPEGVTRLALAEDPEPVFTFEGADCTFRLVPRWRRVVSHFLFLRMLRLRQDLVFFHAASVEVAGRGVLLVGPKGTGKSTLSAALAARGHGFLGDETAAYAPATHSLVPFCRPLSIKPGPRAAAVDDAVRAQAPAADDDGIVRLTVEAFGAAAERPVPLHAVVFLEPFAPEPVLRETGPGGREELALLQPLASSLGPGAGKRVFEMIRLLASARCFRLQPGAPEATAAVLEEAFARP